MILYINIWIKNGNKPDEFNLYLNHDINDWNPLLNNGIVWFWFIYFWGRVILDSVLLPVTISGFQKNSLITSFTPTGFLLFIHSDTIDVIIPYGKCVLCGPGHGCNLHIWLSIVMLVSKIDKHGIPIIYVLNSYYLWFMYNYFFASSKLDGACQKWLRFTFKLIHGYGCPGTWFIKEELFIYPSQ